MLKIFKGQRPDLTPAQVVAVLVAGVPIVGNLLTAFGVYDLSAEQARALQDTLTWGGVFGGLLIGGDAVLRAARNVADAKVQAAIVRVEAEPGEEVPVDVEADAVDDTDLPTDAEERASPPRA